MNSHSAKRLIGASALLTIVAAGLSGTTVHAHGGGGGGGHGGGGGGHFGGGHGGGHFGYGGMGHYGSAGFGHIPGITSYNSSGWSPHAYWYNWNRSSGLWGGWARPWHWSNWYWGWSGIYSPLYLSSFASAYGMGALPNLNAVPNPVTNPDLYLNEASGAAPDEDQTPSLPPRPYRYIPDQADVMVNLVPAAADATATDKAHGAPQDIVSVLHLGPDADITGDGKVVIYLTPDAYLLLTPKATQFIDQETGAPLLSLRPDPFLNWQVAWEIKRQLLMAQMELHNQQANANPSSDDKTALQHAQERVDLLTKAAAGLATSVADSPPATSPPPVPHSLEILSSIWLIPHGEFVALKLYDDSLVYMDQNNVYSDEGKTKLAIPYPSKVKAVLTTYIIGLIDDAAKMHDALTNAKFETEDRIQALREEADLQFGVDGADAARAAERKKNLKLAISKMELELKSINQQLQSMPSEVSAANKLVSAWR